MVGSINFNSESFTFKQFANSKHLNSHSKYIQSCQDFVRDWLSGKQKFGQLTSGSTGRPKTISLTREQMQASAMATASALELESGDSALLCISADYIGGKMMLVRAMEIGFHLTIVAPEANPIHTIIDHNPFEFAAMVPLQVHNLMNTQQGIKCLESIRKVIIGGGEVSLALESRLEDLSNSIFSTYGMTETSSHIALRKLSGPIQEKLFTPLKSIDLQLNEKECLRIKGSITNHQWLDTNDRVELHEDNRFKWLGRVDNVINSGGIKIQIESLEKRIATLLPGLSFMITFRTNDVYGEEVVMLVTSKVDFETRDLIKSSLDRYQAPRDYIVVDHLPLTATNKPDRIKAKKLANPSV